MFLTDTLKLHGHPELFEVKDKAKPRHSSSQKFPFLDCYHIGFIFVKYIVWIPGIWSQKKLMWSNSADAAHYLFYWCFPFWTSLALLRPILWGTHFRQCHGTKCWLTYNPTGNPILGKTLADCSSPALDIVSKARIVILSWGGGQPLWLK